MSAHNKILLILAVLGGVLLAATAVGSTLRALHAGSATIVNLNQRIQAWWGIVALLGAAALAGPAALTGVFALLSFLALREFLTATATGAADRPAMLVCFLIALPAQFAFAALGWTRLFTMALPVGALIVPPLLMALAGEPGNFLARSTELYFGLLLCVYGVSHVPALLELAIPGERQMLLVVFLLLIAQTSDVTQYICGKLFGRRRLSPSISPSKTVEGLAGGIICATALGASLWWITPFSVHVAAGMAFTISVAGAIGGLILSAIRRDRGLKDWSHLVPGHGGALDRLDSLCLSAPLFFHLTQIVLNAP